MFIKLEVVLDTNDLPYQVTADYKQELEKLCKRRFDESMQIVEVVSVKFKSFDRS